MELRKDGHYQGHSHRANHPTNRIALDADEIGPLTEEQCDLLDALERASDCYQIYKSKKLPWGLELEKGDMVLARLPTSATFNGVQYATSIIRWAGMTDCGHRFGVEIMVSELQCVLGRGWFVWGYTYRGQCHIKIYSDTNVVQQQNTEQSEWITTQLCFSR